MAADTKLGQPKETLQDKICCPRVTPLLKGFKMLPLEKKVMTNLNSILQSRDITLPTKVRLVKAMIFPVVIYGCKSWTVKKTVQFSSVQVLSHV